MQLKNPQSGFGLFGTADDIAVQRGIAETREAIVGRELGGLTASSGYWLRAPKPNANPFCTRRGIAAPWSVRP